MDENSLWQGSYLYRVEESLREQVPMIKALYPFFRRSVYYRWGVECLSWVVLGLVVSTFVNDGIYDVLTWLNLPNSSLAFWSGFFVLAGIAVASIAVRRYLQDASKQKMYAQFRELVPDQAVTISLYADRLLYGLGPDHLTILLSQVFAVAKSKTSLFVASSLAIVRIPETLFANATERKEFLSIVRAGISSEAFERSKNVFDTQQAGLKS